MCSDQHFIFQRICSQSKIVTDLPISPEDQIYCESGISVLVTFINYVNCT